MNPVLLLFVIASGVLVSCQDYLRPQFHPMPQKNWMNDPNGPVYYGGYYHLFMQYNPNAPVWGDMHWYHLISTDLAHWKVLPVALAPDQPYDAAGVFTGSITILNDGTPVALYTGQTNNGELQCVAYPANSSDPTLTSWTKPNYNPVINRAPPGGDNGNFRDPTTAWFDNGNWYAVTGCMLNGKAATLLFSSPDFKTWSFSNVLYSNTNFGNVWECPDFFPVGDNHVIKFSANGQDWWTVGKYDRNAHQFTPLPNAQIYPLSYGMTYASKSFSDTKTPSKQRQIMWSWISEEDSAGPSRGWQGVMSLPAVISVDMDILKPVMDAAPELEALRGSHFSSSNVNVNGRTPLVVRGNQLEILAVFRIPPSDGNFGIRFYESADTSQFVYVNVQKSGSNYQVSLDRSRSGTSGGSGTQGGQLIIKQSENTITLHVFVDHSIVDVFAQFGRSKIISRLYTPQQNVGISLFSSVAVNVVSVDVWQMNSCWI